MAINTIMHQTFEEYVLKKNCGREQIDLYDENRNYIRTIYREETIRKDEWKKCILCFVIDKNGNFLIEIRKDGEKDGCSGHIKHYEVATQALLRELYEEYRIEIEEALGAMHLGNIKINFQETDNKLQCFLDIYCLIRTRENDIEFNEEEIVSLEAVPYREFFRKFLNNEIFKYTKEYEPILGKLKEIVKERFEGKIVTQELCRD